MASPHPAARGSVHSIVYVVLRRDGKWAAFTTSDVPHAEENARPTDHSLDL